MTTADLQAIKEHAAALEAYKNYSREYAVLTDFRYHPAMLVRRSTGIELYSFLEYVLKSP